MTKNGDFYTMIRVLPVALVVALAAPPTAAEPLAPGTSVGKRPGPYSFLVATGPQRGKQTCYICEQHDADRAGMVVFARTTSPALGKLLAQLDAAALAKKDTNCKAWMTLLAEKADLDALAQWAQKEGLKALPVGAFEDADGPPAYKLHKDADVTVILFTKQKATATFAFRAGELDAAATARVLKAVGELFDTK
jgi:hypothetical protein